MLDCHHFSDLIRNQSDIFHLIRSNDGLCKNKDNRDYEETHYRSTVARIIVAILTPVIPLSFNSSNTHAGHCFSFFLLPSSTSTQWSRHSFFSSSSPWLAPTLTHSPFETNVNTPYGQGSLQWTQALLRHQAHQDGLWNQVIQYHSKFLPNGTVEFGQEQVAPVFPLFMLNVKPVTALEKCLVESNGVLYLLHWRNLILTLVVWTGTTYHTSMDSTLQSQFKVARKLAVLLI